MSEDKATYGTGQQIVTKPDRPEQLEKENPKNEMPRKVGFVNPAKEGDQVIPPTGHVFDLDTGEVSKPQLVEISGRKIDVSEFGERGVGFLQEMYDEFLKAVQLEYVSTYQKVDAHEGGTDTSRIIDEADKVDPNLRKLLESAIAFDGGVRKHVLKLRWTPHRTFEEWLGWSAATLRWRLNYELERRAVRGLVSWEDVVLSKEVLSECLVAIEKYLALSERARLIGI
jgi:hypothetical protein